MELNSQNMQDADAQIKALRKEFAARLQKEAELQKNRMTS